MRTKTITIFIAGAVLTAGFMMGFGGYVFAGDPVPGLDITIVQIPGGRVSDTIYDSSFSKTKSIGQVRMEVGNVLLRYSFGGEYINQVTEALEGNGVYEAELKSFLLEVGMNEKDTQNILLEFDKIGISKDDTQAIFPDAPVKEVTDSAVPSATVKQGAGQIEKTEREISTPDATGAVPRAGDPVDGIDISLDEIPVGKIYHTPDDNNVFREAVRGLTENLKTAESKEQREDIRKEFQANRETLQESAETLRQNLRENAKELRENFRENVKTIIGHVDHGKTARIAVAHGKGLRMINRYRSAIARFDHILDRLESRIEKIENEAQARAKGKIKDAFPPTNLVILIEEAKNMQALNEAKLVELQAKYESLLTGQNPGGIAKEAREIAKELKSEIEKLHGLLDDIKQATTDYNSSVSNSSTSL